MKNFLTDLLLFLLLLALTAAAVFAPAAAAPEAESVRQTAQAEFSRDGTLHVLLVEAAEGRTRYFSVEEGCSYAELFALAQLSSVPQGFDSAAPLSFSDAVLIGSEYYLYIVI